MLRTFCSAAYALSCARGSPRPGSATCPWPRLYNGPSSSGLAVREILDYMLDGISGSLLEQYEHRQTPSESPFSSTTIGAPALPRVKEGSNQWYRSDAG